jgi:hypothetical protein
MGWIKQCEGGTHVDSEFGFIEPTLEVVGWTTH